MDGQSARSIGYQRRRELRANESFRSAAACIGPVVPGMAVFALTRGQFSMIDVIQHLLTELGGGHLSIWTWAIADYEIESLAGLMARPDIRSARLVVDQSGRAQTDHVVGVSRHGARLDRQVAAAGQG
jgi:hypothetical protein